jgi:hypothetical protein
MKVDFKKLRTDIALPDFLLKLGWKFAPGSSNSSPKMTDGNQTIVIKRNNAGQYTYWDVHGDARGRSVIDLMQQHIYRKTGRMPTLREVGETLQGYIDQNTLVLSDESRFNVGSSALDEDQILALNAQLRPYNGDFLQRRGLSQETLDSPTFKNVFTSRLFRRDGRIYNNTCIRLVGQHGFQGISQRGIRAGDGKSFKGISGSKYASIAVSKYDSSRPIDMVYIGESMIDCASHYQMKHLNTHKNLLYISTEGNITEGQLELIKLLLKKQKAPYTCIFDNDKNGFKYLLKLNSFISGQPLRDDFESLSEQELRTLAIEQPNIELSKASDWNEDLQLMAKNVSSGLVI